MYGIDDIFSQSSLNCLHDCERDDYKIVDENTIMPIGRIEFDLFGDRHIFHFHTNC